MNSIIIGHFFEKQAAYGQHVDRAVRELRAKGNDRLAEALLSSAGKQIRSPRDLKAVRRMAGTNMSPTLAKGMAQALGDKPAAFRHAAKGNGALTGAAQDVRRAGMSTKQLINDIPMSNARAHRVPRGAKVGGGGAAGRNMGGGTASWVAKKPMSTKQKAALGIGTLLLAGGGAMAFRSAAKKKREQEQRQVDDMRAMINR